MSPRASRPSEPAPETIVSGGEFEFGRFASPFLRANMLDVSRPYHYPVPRFVKNWRLKEWQSFQFGNQRWHFSAGLYNAKLFSQLHFWAWDRAEKRRYGFKRLLPGSAFRLPENLQASHSGWRGGHCLIEAAFELSEGGVRLRAHNTTKRGARSFSGYFNFSYNPKQSATNSVCLPLGLNRAMYSSKMLMPVEGEFLANGETHRLDAPASMGFMEDQKGYYPYRMRSDWAAAYGLDAKGRRTGFYLSVNQIKDQERNCENCLWINNRIWPLPPVKVTRPQGPAGEWIIQDTAGMVDLIFLPEVPNDTSFRLGLIESDCHAPFGSFRGLVKNGEGEKIQAELLFGAGEQRYIRA